LIPALPLLAAVVIGLFGPSVLGKNSHWPSILAVGGSCIVAVIVFLAVYNGAHAAPHGEVGGAGAVEEHRADTGPDVKPTAIITYYPWFQIGNVNVGVTLRADALSAMMMVMVTFISFLIVVYARGYMDGDAGYPRFFMAMSLFVFSMSVLVLGDNLPLLFLGWEGVGLCSYLLIGHWFTKPEAAAAARKAFLLNRIGDMGMILGMLMTWTYFGSFEYGDIFKDAAAKAVGGYDSWIVFGCCMLLFCGAMGKSAQFPLHVWLPDAMEGPTPVSALIHAATMVTAGVYLVARFTPLFVLSPGAQIIVGIIGGTTALLSALMALTQNDLKRVLAYSTLSQLGYMFMALSAGVAGGTPSLVTFAVVAAMFHLFTHAFFKALLFLGAGSVMHAMGGVIDMRKFSGLRTVMPTTHWTFLIGALALAGFPLLSGFWSKDEIVASLGLASGQSPKYGTVYLILWVVSLLTAFLTAFYTFRAYFKTFWGPLVVPPEAGSHGHDHAADHAHEHGHGHEHTPAPSHGPTETKQGVAHESPPVMTVPLVILAVFAAGVGFALGPTHLFAHFLGAAPGFPPEGAIPLQWTTMITSAVIALVGIALAYRFYVVQPELPDEVAKKTPFLYQLSYNRFYFDELYAAFIVGPLNALAYICRVLDYNLVDGLVDLVGNVPRAVGYLFRPVQNGLVQFYALAMVLALSVFLMALVRSL
jgi:NADH-quinone oxidoreductase subunit L